ncbi:protein toll-like [Pectinophora gossypiella]|uniref:protein toll-like n=1 Tax=Pectinophora gossypiella TaxID=13191 RepID=UPI00214F5871|nr:protein toll-like [Pectinophora gossypiella]
MWRLVLVLVLGVARASCPDSCVCDPDRLDCTLPSTMVTIKMERGGVIVNCQPLGEDVAWTVAPDGSWDLPDTTDWAASGFNCSQLPQQPLTSAVRLELRQCTLPDSIGCTARRLGAPAPLALYLMDVGEGDALQASHVDGLQGLDKLAIFGRDAAINATIPTEALAALPALHSFTINQLRLAFRPGDFASAPHLKYLELSYVGITHLPAGAFHHLAELQYLNLWRNQLEELGDGLQGLASLQKLELSANRLRSLSPLLTSPPPLTMLSAFANNLTLLPPLAPLTQLETLKLFDNVSPLLVSPRALAGLPRLRTVDMSRSGVTSLPEDVLSGATGLAELRLSGNKLKDLPDHVFQDLMSLEHLDLSYNQLAAVSSQLFSSLKKLKKLNLKNNQLAALPADSFSRQYALTWLDVSYNQLRALPTPSLRGAVQLEHIDLSYNSISDENDTQLERYQLLEGAWASLTSVRVLSLSHNRLAAMPPALPVALAHLQDLDLSYNRITQLTGEDVYFLSDAARVDVTHNAVERVFPLYMLDAAQPGPARAQRATVMLDDNPFHCDCQLYALAQRFRGLTSQVTTEASFDMGAARCAQPPALRGRLVTAVPLHDFACHINRTECDVDCACVLRPHTLALELTCPAQPTSYPQLAYFGVSALDLTLTQPPTTFNLSDNIRTLNLSGLNLQELPKGPLPISVKTLDLSRNSFSRIPRELLEMNVTLRVSRNPLVCDCWRAGDVAALQQHWEKIEDYTQVNCTGDIPVESINVQQLCSTARAATVGGVLAAVGLLVAVVAVLLVRYSDELKVWLYARGWLLRWLAIDDDDRRYDAFISFCHKDEEFVRDHLIPGLEAPPHQYKLCVHYRDWIPGEWIPAQIAQSVADSRRTVIVVSQNFLDSIWGRAEFRAANMSAIKERKTRVIVVLLEDITSHKELDPELKLYLSTNTYLKWGDPWFWDKLRYALPHRRVAPLARGQREGEKMKQTRIAKTVAECGLDTRLTSEGVIINAAALAVSKKVEHLHLDVASLKKDFDCY